MENGQSSEPELYSNEDLQIVDLPGHALLGDNGGNTAECASQVRRDGCLHAHFDGLEGAQSHVGDQLRGGTGCQVERSLPLVGAFLADQVTVELLEEFVAAIFECSLGLSVCVSFTHLGLDWVSYTVAEERGAPACKHTPEALGSTDLVVGLHVALVEIGVDLTTTFDQIQRSHCGVSEALFQLVVRPHFPGISSLTQANSPPTVQAA